MQEAGAVTVIRSYCFVCNSHMIIYIYAGSANYVAVTEEDGYYITILDLKTMTFMKKFRGFEKIPLDDGDFDEYDVEAITIHPDETQLAYTNMFNSEVVVATLEGKRIRSIPRTFARFLFILSQKK